ncbi:MAG: DNA mismatch repair protein MutS, partial [Lentisphaerae bacterium]|nr:DNA mismatch repair protein MutS [Lentisphaerota bacterium]
MAEALTPMMRQYRRIKGELPSDVILFFRLGDFYEMFFEDAQAAAPILDIALTKRNHVPMCGVPYHAVDGYLARLIRAGRKVALCDQVEDADASKRIVRREITRVVTPGTAIEDAVLESGRHNFLAAVVRDGDTAGAAFLDLSTGLFYGEEADARDGLPGVLQQAAPAECVIPAAAAEDPELRRAFREAGTATVSPGDDWPFEYEAAHDVLVRHFGVQSLAGFGCDGHPAIVRAAGGVLHHVREALRRDVGHVRGFRVRQAADMLLLDDATCRNLDLVPRPGARRETTLLGVLDVTRTAMGARLLRDWIVRPAADPDRVRARHDAVAALTEDRALLRDLRDALEPVRDLERLVARLGSGTGNARDVRAIGASLARVPALRDGTAAHPAARIRALGEQLRPLPELVGLIERALVDESPLTIRDGGLIRAGYREALDALRQTAAEGKQWLARYQASEQARTGIKNLKVRHNKVFGYYIEITKGQLGHVPDDYTRKQTLVNAERFITPELKEYENRVFGAQERAMGLEYELFQEVRQGVVEQTAAIQATAAAVAELDVLGAFADRALALGYTRPVITGGAAVRIKAGRHPVVEQMPDAERFVPNDTLLDCGANQLVILTGPNMAGKSTYIRQVALIVIMAQMGAFVPADEAELGLVDRIFTRVGASDDLARGRSTFMVEMQETANILNNATPRSLIVLDEIGRGTSTFDGISIAWAVAEFLHNHDRVKAKTLFATHYHELTDLARTMPGIKNYNVQVRERNGTVVFLRRIVPGGADKSYGIQVARLAGLPPE